jgi:hypothetical protein
MSSNVGKTCFKLWCVLCAVHNILYVLYKGAFVGDRNLSVIKMHGATIKIFYTVFASRTSQENKMCNNSCIQKGRGFLYLDVCTEYNEFCK